MVVPSFGTRYKGFPFRRNGILSKNRQDASDFFSRYIVKVDTELVVARVLHLTPDVVEVEMNLPAVLFGFFELLPLQPAHAGFQLPAVLVLPLLNLFRFVGDLQKRRQEPALNLFDDLLRRARGAHADIQMLLPVAVDGRIMVRIGGDGDSSL